MPRWKVHRLLSVEPDYLSSMSLAILHRQKLYYSQHQLFPVLTLSHPVRALFWKWPYQEGHETEWKPHVRDRTLSGRLLLQSKHVLYPLKISLPSAFIWKQFPYSISGVCASPLVCINGSFQCTSWLLDCSFWANSKNFTPKRPK